VGAALAEGSLRWFQSQQVLTIQASIWQRNAISFCFFQKLGFAVVEVMMHKRLLSAEQERMKEVEACAIPG
jgi:hypothetical protein